MQNFLPSSLFCRINKSFIVSLDRVVEFNADMIYLKDKQMPIGLQYKSEFHKSVMIVNDTPGIMKPGISFSAEHKVNNIEQYKKFF